ncbi:MAG: nuclear transport factor 2 family protein [Dehalococcoidia bacterium]|nr:nuclear transport factor 2 family protein [Dehalococcoidia bacterium]
MFAPDIAYHTGGQTSGVAAARRGDEQLFAAIPDACRTIDHAVADDTMLVQHRHFDGTVKATGTPVRWEGCSWMRIEDGLFVEAWTFWDPALAWAGQGGGTTPSSPRTLPFRWRGTAPSSRRDLVGRSVVSSMAVTTRRGTARRCLRNASGSPSDRARWRPAASPTATGAHLRGHRTRPRCRGRRGRDFVAHSNWSATAVRSPD